MEDASMGEQEKLLRLPNYLVRQPLELFRKLRLADQSYFQVRQILLDLYPESSEASFAKYFAMKLTGQTNLETYYREKTAMGLQLGLPQEVILETLTEGLPFNDQRLVRVVPPENLGEWFRLVQRIHGPSVPATRSREDQPPTMSGPYHSTSRRPGHVTPPDWGSLSSVSESHPYYTRLLIQRCMDRSDLFHGQDTTTSVGRYCDQGAWTDLICSMDKTPPPQLAGIVIRMTTELPQIQKFNGDNFHLWKFQMKIILEAKYLLSITDGSEVKPEIEDIAKFSNWKKKDAKSKMLITTALEFKYLQQIVNCQTSAEMWKKLSTIYELKSETNKYLLQQRFFEYKMNPNDNIATHISKVETLAQQMKDLAWDSVSSEEKTLENLTARLLKEESLQDHWDSSGNSKPDNALMTFSKFNRNSTASNKQQQHQQSIKDKKKNTHCGYCKKKGHWWKECYKRKEEQKGQQPSSSSRDDSCAFSAETSAFLAETKDSWIADSGATDHMTFRREWFSTFEEIPEGVHPVCLGDGKKIYAKVYTPCQETKVTVSGTSRTISRRLVANGLHSCRPLRRLPLTPPNRRQRLEWCRARSTWMTEWHRVVFSDESRFCLSSDSRRVRVWRRRGERSNPAAIVERPTVQQRGIMVWGAIAYDSRSPLLRIQGTMTAQRYVDDVLRPVTLPYLQGVPNALYQQYNARPHTARIGQQALQDVQMLPWPPYSPDLSPIEQVWDIIGRRLHALPQPRSEDELWQMPVYIACRYRYCSAVRPLIGEVFSDRQSWFFAGAWTDLICSMDKTPPPQLAGIVIRGTRTDLICSMDKTPPPQLAGIVIRGTRTDLICSMDKTPPPPQLAGIVIRVHGPI
ncbi:hypothetical protein LAZ67_4004146 [Cordylochernes scorpioides]|uniref:Gag-pol polyprotein n=1 Tax=Cordylochernes scorpioides TaxID=51811 RepID=A0ABY6KEF7_9ARAC|nr:hypothetical protein LAZ67_4004146 [Cordylochernes scorpioides]